MHDTRPTVAVVVCTHDGARYLDLQLDSIAAQSWPVEVFVHDDHSSDDTVARARAHPLVPTVLTRPTNVGFVHNFELAIRDALERGFDHVALADQDDVWDPDKIERSMQALLAAATSANEPPLPVLCHSDLRMIDRDGAPIAASYAARRRHDIGAERNLAIVLGRNGVMGNTITINRELATLALPFPPGISLHDWWLAVVAELYGRRVWLDRPTLDYRVHDTNTSNRADKFGADGRRSTQAAWVRALYAIASRDLKLPYKEDVRLPAIDWLLDGEEHGLPALEFEDRAVVEDFRRYLTLAGPRLSLLRMILARGFLRSELRHRLRVAIALLTSRRYARAAAHPDDAI